MSIPKNPIKTAAVPKRSPGAPKASGTLPANEAPVKPSAATPHKGTPAAATSPMYHGNNSSVEAIKEMQREILKFADVAASTDITALKGKNTGLQEGPQTYDLTDAGISSEIDPNASKTTNHEYLGGTDPFGNFLVQQYLGQSDPVGHQFLNVDIKGPTNREKQSIEDVNIRGIIDTIKRIGTPGSYGTEKSVDGVWGVRTNNAIKNIFALAYAMVNLAKDMGLNLQGYSENNLDTFKTLIPNQYTDVPANEKGKKAKEITANIKSITNLFQSFRKSVMDNKEYRPFIEQSKSFIKHPQSSSKSAKDVLNDSENKFYNTNLSTKIPNINLSNVSQQENYVTLFDLSNMNNFKKFMARIGRNANDSQEVQKSLDEVSKAVGNSSFEAGF